MTGRDRTGLDGTDGMERRTDVEVEIVMQISKNDTWIRVVLNKNILKIQKLDKKGLKRFKISKCLNISIRLMNLLGK